MPGTLNQYKPRVSKSRRAWHRFVAIRITAAQAAEMEPILRPHAILLIDRHYNSLARYHPERPSLYAVDTGDGLLVRYVTMKANRLVLRCYSHAQPSGLLEPKPGQHPTELLVGRVCQSIGEL